jgi:hypothetical protein
MKITMSSYLSQKIKYDFFNNIMKLKSLFNVTSIANVLILLSEDAQSVIN